MRRLWFHLPVAATSGWTSAGRSLSKRAKTGCPAVAERFVRELLAAQAAAGYITYDAAAGAFAMPPEHVMVLADETVPSSSAASSSRCAR
jgi:hypothetical protein